jgi:hypothetical protein
MFELRFKGLKGLELIRFQSYPPDAGMYYTLRGVKNNKFEVVSSFIISEK